MKTDQAKGVKERASRRLLDKQREVMNGDSNMDHAAVGLRPRLSGRRRPAVAAA